MHVCIQDPAQNTSYFINERELAKFSAGAGEEHEADVLLVASGNTLLQELPSSRLSDSDTPTIQIVDPDANGSWVIPFESLKRYAVADLPGEAEDVHWFAMPSARDALAAVPVFRRALVQHSS